MNEFMSSENEANKRKLQQIQIKLDETQTKEQGTLAKLQECIQIVEQGQFEKNEVRIFNYSRSFRSVFCSIRQSLNVIKLKLNLLKHKRD